jgi:long-subunit acyl-CoA synthetase (AMP-forming)
LDNVPDDKFVHVVLIKGKELTYGVLREDEKGELWVRGTQTVMGYVNTSAANAEAFVAGTKRTTSRGYG